MKKYRLFSAISLVATILLAACTQDEWGGQGTSLPEGEYPLQISGVSITAEAGEQPWTRVTESTDGMSSVWRNGDKIGVRIGDSEETGIYVVNVDENGTVTSITPEKPVYWTSATSATVTAWYPATDGAVYLNRQDDNGLAYVMRGTGQGSHQNPVTLTFTHQLAKVRVVTKGTAEVLNMELADFPEVCVVTEGKITEVSSYTRDIPMRQVTYEGIGKCWEVNVTPGVELEAFMITVPVGGFDGTYYSEWGSTVTMEAGMLHTIELTVNRNGTVNLSQQTQTYTISADGDYYFNGTGSHGIRVTSGNPTIYLGDAHISVASGNAISIESGSATIHVLGDNSVTSSNGAGIYVAEGSTVTITGRDRNDVLTSTGGAGSAGIGSYSTSDGTNYSCGNIIISNVTLTARSEGFVGAGDYAAGIGSAGLGTVGSISISDATIYAQGYGDNYNMGAAAIGGGVDGASSDIQTAFDITISNSTIHATRGCPHASYIGAGGYNGVKPAGYNIISTAKIPNSHIYDGNGNELTQ